MPTCFVVFAPTLLLSTLDAQKLLRIPPIRSITAQATADSLPRRTLGASSMPQCCLTLFLEGGAINGDGNSLEMSVPSRLCRSSLKDALRNTINNGVLPVDDTLIDSESSSQSLGQLSPISPCSEHEATSFNDQPACPNESNTFSEAGIPTSPTPSWIGAQASTFSEGWYSSGRKGFVVQGSLGNGIAKHSADASSSLTHTWTLDTSPPKEKTVLQKDVSLQMQRVKNLEHGLAPRQLRMLLQADDKFYKKVARCKNEIHLTECIIAEARRNGMSKTEPKDKPTVSIEATPLTKGKGEGGQGNGGRAPQGPSADSSSSAQWMPSLPGSAAQTAPTVAKDAQGNGKGKGKGKGKGFERNGEAQPSGKGNKPFTTT